MTTTTEPQMSQVQGKSASSTMAAAPLQGSSQPSPAPTPTPPPALAPPSASATPTTNSNTHTTTTTTSNSNAATPPPDSPLNSPADFTPLSSYASRGALVTALHQSLLLELTSNMGPHAFDVNLQEGTITFLPSDDTLPPTIMKAHLIASLAPGPRSLLWGWAHPRGDYVSQQLRAQGEKDRVEILTRSEVPFPPAFPHSEEGEEEDLALSKLAHEVAMAAVGITLMAPYYCAPNGRSRAVFLLDGEGLPNLTLDQVVERLPKLLANGEAGEDHHAALHGLADAMGWYLSERVEGEDADVSLRDGGSCVDFSFDGQGRIRNIQAASAAKKDERKAGVTAGKEEIKADVRKILESQPKSQVQEQHGKGGCCVVM